MRKLISLTVLSATALGLSACGSPGLYDRGSPDEFAVSRQAPLVIPPEFSLTPPAPGSARASAMGNEEQVLEALFGGAAPRSAGEAAIISRAGDADMGIRSSVGDPQTPTVNKGSTTRDIIAAPQGDGQGTQAVIP